jgi:hypothetical protein
LLLRHSTDTSAQVTNLAYVLMVGVKAHVFVRSTHTHTYTLYQPKLSPNCYYAKQRVVETGKDISRP